MNKEVSFKDIYENEEINEYIKVGNEVLGNLGYTEHGYVHAMKSALLAGRIIEYYSGSKREVELAKIAGYMHDIGNMINRTDHAHTGAIIAVNILRDLGMPPAEIGVISTAIGNHDENTGKAVSRVSSALILADKSDVNRLRVRNTRSVSEDIHDRVNYAVTDSMIEYNKENITLKLTIDTEICSVIEYFKIFLGRMYMCQSAAEFLQTKFKLIINDSVLM
ncbi:MAG: HD domain-containing protein [Clostridia bacterium]|nr:HD domain-containing protein [Clostridia bacterium]